MNVSRQGSLASPATWIGIASLVVLLVVTLSSAVPLTYDEPWYLSVVDKLYAEGFSVRFLRELPGPAGPTHALMFAALGWFTGLLPPGVRAINLLLLCGTLLITHRSLRLLSARTPWSEKSAHSGTWLMMSVPMTWVMAGLALTEFSAIVWSAAGLLLLLLVIERQLPPSIGLLLCGLCLGVAVIGRQPLLAYVVCLPLLVPVLPKPRRDLPLTILAALVLPLALFSIWGGIVPPSVTRVTAGIAIPNAVLATSYIGLCTILIAPRFLWFAWPVLLGCLVLGLAINIPLQFVSIAPMMTVSQRILPAAMLPHYRTACSGAFLAVSLLVLVSFGRRAWEERKNPFFLYLVASLAFVAATCLKVTHVFSSRYVGQAAPALVLLLAPYNRGRPIELVLLVVGSVLGMFSYWSYLS